MDQSQRCIECLRKDEIITELREQLKKLGYQPIDVQVEESNEPPPSARNQLKHKQSIVQTINIYKPRKPSRGNTTKVDAPQEEKPIIGSKFYENFIVFGPDFDLIQDVEEQRVSPKVLYSFPHVEQNDFNVISKCVFPTNIRVNQLKCNKEDFKDKVLPNLKEIIMQTLNSIKGDNEFTIAIPREDILTKQQDKYVVTRLVQESNINIYRFLICYELSDFYCPDPNSFTCYTIPLVFCFMTYLPFQKFFMKQNTEIWNQMKIQRLQPFLQEDWQCLKHDTQFMIKKMDKCLTQLMDMRSIKAEFEQKYKFGDVQILIPKLEQARGMQFSWGILIKIIFILQGAYRTFQHLSLKELILIISHVLLSQKVVIFSQNKGLLSSVMMTVVSLVYPFEFAPSLAILLPIEQIDQIQAPSPYFFGILGNYKDFQDRLNDYHEEDLSFIDLDYYTLNLSQQQSKSPLKKYFPPLKKIKTLRTMYQNFNSSRENRFEKKKKQLLQGYLSMTSDQKENSREIQKIFSNFWQTTIISIIPIEHKYKTGLTGLNMNLIVASMLERCPKECKIFLNEFVQSPIFSSYVDKKYEKEL